MLARSLAVSVSLAAASASSRARIAGAQTGQAGIHGAALRVGHRIGALQRGGAGEGHRCITGFQHPLPRRDLLLHVGQLL
jgi:hypothetical protein